MHERMRSIDEKIYILNRDQKSAARITIVVPCVCVCVCVYMFDIHSNQPPHTLGSQKRGTNGFIAIREPFKILTILVKMLGSKVMA